MALVVQSDDGNVLDANAYLSVATFKAYHDARGQSYGSATDTAIESAIVKATTYLDTRWRFRGYPTYGRDQSTVFPRNGLVDAAGYVVSGMPREVIRATSEYALVALTSSLYAVPSLGTDGKEIEAKTETVGPITESVTYVDGGMRQRWLVHSAADALIRSSGFIESGGNLVRG